MTNTMQLGIIIHWLVRNMTVTHLITCIITSAGVTELEKPALAVRVEEGVSEVIAIVFWDLEGLVAYAVIQFLKRGGGRGVE